MALTIVNSSGSTVLTATVPLAYTADTYYFKRLIVGSVSRKIYIDSTPSARGSFAQDFDDAMWPISGGSLLIRGTSEVNCKATFQTLAPLIKHQIGLTLAIPNESTYTNCVCTNFELFRFQDGCIVKPDGNSGATFRAYVLMDFVQLSR